MPLHVAHFVHRYPPALGGAEAYFARLSEYLAGCGDSVDVWTTTAIDLNAFWGRGHVVSEGTVLPTEEPVVAASLRAEDAHPLAGSRRRHKDTVVIHRFCPLHFPLRRYILKALSLIPHRPWQLLTAPSNPVCPAMWRAVHRYSGPLDAVHATAFPYGFPLMCGLKLARRRRVPFLLTPFLHLGDPFDPHDRTRRQYTRPPLVWLLKQADRVFVQTPSEFRLAAELGVSESRLALQGLGVNPAECTGGDRAKARARWGVSDDTFVIGHLANNSVEKGTVDLLEATKGKPWHTVLAGPEMPNFTWAWGKLGPMENVTRLGVLTDEQKRDFYAAIDAFCLPSRTDSFGLVLLEAWANGKPVVAYRAGGPADLIRDEIDGFLVKCGDLTELATRLTGLTANPSHSRQMGELGCQRVTAEFGWENKLKLVRDTVVSVCGHG